MEVVLLDDALALEVLEELNVGRAAGAVTPPVGVAPDLAFDVAELGRIAFDLDFRPLEGVERDAVDFLLAFARHVAWGKESKRPYPLAGGPARGQARGPRAA